MTDFNISISNPGKDNLFFQIDYSIDMDPGPTDTEVKRYLREALYYIAQADTGMAILETLMQNTDRVPIGIRQGCTYSPRDRAVRWNPYTASWFVDVAESWGRRDRGAPNNLTLPLRPESQDGTEYHKGHPKLVFGLASPPLMLMHEFGHMVQHLTRPHAFSDEQTRVNQEFKKVIKVDDDEELLIVDLDYPAEVDNVNWNEKPFAIEQRKLGAYEGVRWHYGDAGVAITLDDWGAIRHTRGPYLLKILLGGTWYKLTRFWEVPVARGKEEFRDKDFKALKIKDFPPLDGFPDLEPMKMTVQNAIDFSSQYM